MITAIDDGDPEGQETFNITWDSSLASVSFSPATIQVTIEGTCVCVIIIIIIGTCL